MNYNVVSNIYLRKLGVYTHDALGRYAKLAYKQGDLDGACTVYSLVMCLLRYKYLSTEDLNIFVSPDRRTAKGKFLHEFLENNGLVRDGYSFVVLRRELENYIGNDFEVTRYAPKTPGESAQRIVELLNDDITPIISVEWDKKLEGAHAMLAIGYEMDDQGIVTKILCLDPSSDEPSVSPWNCFVDVSKTSGEYPHRVVSSIYKSTGCLDDMIAIVPRVIEVAD
jgi:hypothetical protein